MELADKPVKNEPRWVTHARKFYGLKEAKGPKTNPVIAGWLKTLKAWYGDDETPWCGTFLGAVFHEMGYKIPAVYMRAKDWLKWGKAVPICFGAVGIKSRVGGGHVTIIVGRTREGKLVGLGGNQGDAVSYATFDPKVFEGFRWPINEPLPIAVGMASLPLIQVNNNAPVSEA